MDNPSTKNMQELLRFAIKHQQNKGNECIEIDEDKKQFLDHVLRSMSVNVIDEFLKAISILQRDDSTDDEKVESLDLIRDYIDNIDFANSFVKIEGADILINCMRNVNKTVRINAIKIVAEMSQNNSFCQQYFIKYDIIEQLIKYLNDEDTELATAALYALSALMGNFEPALMEFMQKDGLNNVYKCLSVESPRLFSKACFLITSMSSDFSLIRDEYAKLGVFDKLVKKLRVVNGYEVEIEMVLRTMSAVIESRYCNPHADVIKYIIDTLNSIIIKNRNLAECEEIVFYSNSILKQLENGVE